MIPPGRPQHNGAVENFHSWFQPRLFQRHYSQVSTLKRELLRLQETVNHQHVQSRIGGSDFGSTSQTCQNPQAATQLHCSHRTACALQHGYITFFRQVTAHGNVHLLSQTFFVGKRVKGEYVKVQLDTKRAQLTVYRQGRIFKRWPYPFLKK
ncbi:MAG: hypothetical protein MZV64_62920 [Ignavibacteriales bacterium]|nr:hypothetical protein [Ignavibacteriales bacterium]